MRLSRRAFVRAASAAAVAGAFDRWLGAQVLRPVDGGRMIRTMPLGRFDGRPAPPLHQLLGTGLDARQFTDLSGLAPDRLVTPTEHFYIRTAHPPLPPVDSWRITLGGLVEREQDLDRRTLEEQAIDIGIRLMECAGNSDPANFGLLSAARWSGVPVAAILDRIRPKSGAARLKVTGIDDDERPTVTSNPGASWIFTRDELERRGAFLATAMNGAALTPDHGAPVRLVVPNYYGCACIKWVTRIDWVTDDEPATTQMLEFSSRTHQAGIPQRARDYAPPVIELAAAPVRVEQWQVGDRITYRVVGIRWGGEARVAPLTIRFRSGEPPIAVTDVPETDNPATWSLWSHAWTPDAAGRYQIALGVADASVPARRLGLYFYTRAVEIDRI